MRAPIIGILLGLAVAAVWIPLEADRKRGALAARAAELARTCIDFKMTEAACRKMVVKQWRR